MARAPDGYVRLASGDVVKIGTEGTAQGGRYHYTVLADGSVAKDFHRHPELDPVLSAEPTRRRQDDSLEPTPLELFTAAFRKKHPLPTKEDILMEILSGIHRGL